MGQLKIKGSAQKEFKADMMEVVISISIFGETSHHAINRGKQEAEQVLQLLVDMGINLSDVTMNEDSVSTPNRYNEYKFYQFEKEMSFISEANLSIIEALSEGIVENKLSATYKEKFYLSNIGDAKKIVLQEALLDSKKKAEALAETLGQKIIGMELARCSEYNDCDDDDVIEPCTAVMCIKKTKKDSLAAQLSPDIIIINRNIDVSWIVE